MAFRFYNGYDKINESIPFDNNNDIKTDNVVSYWLLKADAQSFFEAPEYIRFGRQQVFTRFDETIMSKYAPMGIVQVDPEADPSSARWPTAANDAAAKERGDEVYESYLIDLVQKYVSGVEERKAQGLTCIPAQGYIKHALKKLNIADPALNVRNHVERASETSEIKALKEQVAALTALVGEGKKRA